MAQAKKDEFKYCPWCGGAAIESCDYDDDEEGDESVYCTKGNCHWQGDRAELVCKDPRGKANG